MMFDNVIFLINVSTISQLKSLLVPKNSKDALSIESCFQLSTKLVGRSTYLIITWNFDKYFL
jgi:hypothetical protein